MAANEPIEMSVVWAYQPIPELGNQLGFVSCTKAVADKLIAAGEAQDPRGGGNSLKHIVDVSVQPVLTKKPAGADDTVQQYATKVMTAAAPATQKTPKKAS